MRIATAFALLLLTVASTKADARLRDQWVVGFGQGVLEYSNYLDNEDRTRIVISDASTAYDGGQVQIFLSINGKSPKPKTQVKFFIDGDLIPLFADNERSISTDCRACAANFDGLWAALRRGRNLVVQFDGLRATFSLQGSAKALPEQPPVADFYR